MNILTPTGYKNIADVNIGDDVCAFDIETGEPIINQLLEVDYISKQYYIDYFPEELDTFKWYLINGTHKIFYAQSIWTSHTTVIHGYQLQVGDTFYDENNEDCLVETLEEIECEDEWVRLLISGDHSFISDNVTFHNASRFLVAGGTGNWNSTTNWSGTSGGGSGSSFPINGDAVTFDTASANANMTVNVSSACTSMVVTGTYAGTFTMNNTLTVAGTFTLLSTMSLAASTVNQLLLLSTTGTTITSAGLTWPCSIRFGTGSSATFTLGDAWVISGQLQINGNASAVQTVNSNSLTIGTSFNVGISFTNSAQGTAEYIMGGSGNIVCNNNSTIRNPVTINTAGTITLSGIINYGTGTFKYTAGTVTTTGSTLNLQANATLTVNNSGLSLATLLITGDCTINGTNGFTMLNFTAATVGTTITWKNGNTYTTTTSVYINASPTNMVMFVSSTPGSRYNFIVQAAATQNIGQADVTDADSSGGQTLFNFHGVLSNDVNWINLPSTVGFAF